MADLKLVTDIEAEVVKDKEALTAEEQSQANELEGIVDKGLASYVAAGEALSKLKDQHLYVGAWKDYVRDRFDLSYAKANRLIVAAKVVRNLESTVQPVNEGQANELASFDVPTQRKIWSEVLDLGRPTIGKLQEVKRKYVKKEVRQDATRKLLVKMKHVEDHLLAVLEEFANLEDPAKVAIRKRVTELRKLLVHFSDKAARKA